MTDKTRVASLVDKSEASPTELRRPLEFDRARIELPSGTTAISWPDNRLDNNVFSSDGGSESKHAEASEPEHENKRDSSDAKTCKIRPTRSLSKSLKSDGCALIIIARYKITSCCKMATSPSLKKGFGLV